MALTALQGFVPSREGPYTAKSASAKTDNWPFWYVEGGDGVNALRGPGGSVLTIREVAHQLADDWNSRGTGQWL